jgi:hypothetical protein
VTAKSAPTETSNRIGSVNSHVVTPDVLSGKFDQRPMRQHFEYCVPSLDLEMGKRWHLMAC